MRPASSSSKREVETKGKTTEPLKRNHTDLEDMERFKLNVTALVSQQVHHHLEVGLVSDVTRHNGVIRSIEQDLAEKFDRLSFGDVVGGEDEGRIG